MCPSGGTWDHSHWSVALHADDSGGNPGAHWSRASCQAPEACHPKVWMRPAVRTGKIMLKPSNQPEESLVARALQWPQWLITMEQSPCGLRKNCTVMFVFKGITEPPTKPNEYMHRSLIAGLQKWAQNGCLGSKGLGFREFKPKLGREILRARNLTRQSVRQLANYYLYLDNMQHIQSKDSPMECHEKLPVRSDIGFNPEATFGALCWLLFTNIMRDRAESTAGKHSRGGWKFEEQLNRRFANIQSSFSTTTPMWLASHVQPLHSVLLLWLTSEM